LVVQIETTSYSINYYIKNFTIKCWFLVINEYEFIRTNVIPIIEDARHPLKYRMLMGMVDTIFADVAQPDQARIVALNAQYFLKNGSFFRLNFSFFFSFLFSFCVIFVLFLVFYSICIHFVPIVNIFSLFEKSVSSVRYFWLFLGHVYEICINFIILSTFWFFFLQRFVWYSYELNIKYT